MKEPNISVGQDILQLIAEIDEFKGQWHALKTLSTRDEQEAIKGSESLVQRLPTTRSPILEIRGIILA